jgi:glycosyltransferase involved in cell wall biosynthesis
MTQKLPTTSIILPTYNEKENIIPLIEAIHSHVSSQKEIIVVDDNSPDGTAQTVKTYMLQHPQFSIRLIIRTSNRGLVPSINDGIHMTKGKIIAWMDADFSHPPEILQQLIEKVRKNECDVAVASRFGKGGKQKKHVQGESHLGIAASTLLNKILSRLFTSPITDFTSGFIALKKDAIKTYQLQGSYGEYFLKLIEYLSHNKAVIQEIGYISPPRLHGLSKTAPTPGIFIKHGLEYLKTVYAIWKQKK